MGVKTFMVHEGPEYEVTDSVRSYCSVRTCEEEHETTDSGGRRHTVARPWTTTRNDIIRDDTGEVVKEAAYSLSTCGVPGAMFWWDLHDDRADKQDGRSSIFASGPQLCVVLPDGGFWNIDGRARNCTMPDDFEHRCWVRHGEPPDITVDKNGPTCTAGGGSIMSGSYHGFLQHGEFT